MANQKPIEILFKELEEARAAHAEAEREESRARSSTTGAINRLNEAQRAFDTRIEEIRKASPSASDWGQKRWLKTRETPT